MENENIWSRAKKAWNVFFNKDPTENYIYGGFNYRPDKSRKSVKNEKSISLAVFNRIALDVAAIPIQHVRLDENKRYKETINSSLNKCLTESANIDQTGRAFIQDAVMSMFDEGHVALVPVDTIGDPIISESYQILSLRTGRVVEWFPNKVKIELYNERTGRHEEVILPKYMVAIIENPFYAIMNEPNSTLQRLIRKLNILDVIDNQSGSSKLDLIIQLPYSIKTPLRRDQANERKTDIENQLKNSKYGIAYIDSTERITQLNRPVDNNLLTQIEYLTNMFYSQIGVNTSVLDNTATDEDLIRYNTRIIEPIVSALVDGMKICFLSKTARSQNQTLMYFSDPFKLVPVSEIAEIADKLTRNEIMSSNEIRQIIGMKPSDDPNADELRNKNLNEPVEVIQQKKIENQNEEEDNDEI